jgi:DNA adenine methylase
MSQLRIRYPALRYRGGKWRIAPWVIANLPPHECYVEPFAGGASVLLRKPPAEFECLNDLEGDVVAFWRVLRERPHELIGQILTTPFSREELARCQEPVNGNLAPPAADLERARRLWARCYQGRGSSARKSGWRFQMTNQHMRSKFHVHHARAAQRIHGLVDIAVRLTNVQIESADDRENSKRLYSNEMSAADHARLAGLLRGIQGMAVVSGAPGLYDRLLDGWRRIERATVGEAHKARTEVLWLNPAAERALTP